MVPIKVAIAISIAIGFVFLLVYFSEGGRLGLLFMYFHFFNRNAPTHVLRALVAVSDSNLLTLVGFKHLVGFNP